MNDSLIEWAPKTWNPITGCPGPKVSPGCANCYAERIVNTPNLDWVIAGAETGPNKRHMDIVWALSLLKQCRADYSKTPFFFKKDSNSSRLLDGREWNEVPA